MAEENARLTESLGLRITGKVGGGRGDVARPDAGLEVANTSHTDHALISVYQTMNPGRSAGEPGAEECAYVWSARTSTGRVVKQASISTMFSNADNGNGFSVLRLNATTNGGGDDVAMRIFGGRGVLLFGGGGGDRESNAPGARTLRVEGKIVGAETITTFGHAIPDGVWTSVPHSNANFGTDRGNWHVQQHDQAAFEWTRHGKDLHVVARITDSSTAGMPTQLRVAIPGGFAVKPGVDKSTPVWMSTDGGTSWQLGVARVMTGQSNIMIQRNPVPVPFTGNVFVDLDVWIPIA